MTSTSRSWATPKEHSVKNVAFALPPANLNDRAECVCESDRRDLPRAPPLLSHEAVLLFCRLDKGWIPFGCGLPELPFDGDSVSYAIWNNGLALTAKKKHT